MMSVLRLRLLATMLPTAVLLLAGCAATPTHDDYVVRLETLALLQSFNADLLSHDSATATLERWCADHHLADPARIVAQRLHDAAKPLPDELRTRLAIDAGEAVAYRHVQLACGAHVLSEADNWYVPARLTAQMNKTLETTDEPFGKVVKATGFQRRTFAVDTLWSPLPAHWEMRAQAAASRERMQMPAQLLRHQAVLLSSAQVPFSVVVETYTSELFAFRPPRTPR
jgi:chorismate-pyruvate lyase